MLTAFMKRHRPGDAARRRRRAGEGSREDGGVSRSCGTEPTRLVDASAEEEDGIDEALISRGALTIGRERGSSSVSADRTAAILLVELSASVSSSPQTASRIPSQLRGMFTSSLLQSNGRATCLKSLLTRQRVAKVFREVGSDQLDAGKVLGVAVGGGVSLGSRVKG